MPRVEQGVKLRAEEKLKHIPIKIEKNKPLKKPDWFPKIRIQHSARVSELKQTLRANKLVTVCEEASCPNLPECFSHGTATFMIMGDICTRRCTFCDVAHGRPNALDPEEPYNLARTIKDMQLTYVVITSVDRDDLRDGGAGHFAECINATRKLTPNTKIEVLVPDFRGRMEKALEALAAGLPDVFNHNIETVEALYKQVRPGSDYAWSLKLLQDFKQRFPGIPTKSGIMVGLGETKEQVLQVIKDLRAHEVDMLTIGQYLQPSQYHSPVDRYVSYEEYAEYKAFATELGFSSVASGPLVRSSYHADKQAAGEDVS
ncbi:MAG: lipoyl synthase [Gammaproteobacteria bacterium]